MKTKLLIALLTFAGVFSLTACSDDNDDINPGRVPTEVRTEFSQMYPEATNIDWESKYGYYVADFKKGNLDMDAWYDEIGRWQMTETSFDGQLPLMSALPEAIQIELLKKTAEGLEFIVEDVDLYERPGADIFYEVEIEEKTELGSSVVRETTYFYRPDGTLINSVVDFNGEITPTTVIAELK